MSRVVKSFNGSGQLLLPGGEVLSGRYHIDVSYLPVRRIHDIKGDFVLDDAPAWESVAGAQFAGEAIVSMTDGRMVQVTLGGIAGNAVAIVGMERLPEM